MITKIDINETSIVDGIRNKMAVATVTDKGLMPITSCDLEIPAGTCPDANIIYSGWYYFGNVIANVPITSAGFILAHRLFKTSGLCIQYCAKSDNGDLYVRTGKINTISGVNVWSDWKKIYP